MKDHCVDKKKMLEGFPRHRPTSLRHLIRIDLNRIQAPLLLHESETCILKAVQSW